MENDYISPPELIQLMSSMELGKDLLIVDVRDDDRDMGNIVGSLHLPSRELNEARMEAFARSVWGTAAVCVFHCHFSQVRGPTARRLFERVAANIVPDVAQRPRSLILRGGWENFSAHARTSSQAHLVEHL
jgi:rhodanese-related sulfurtransferase